MNAVPLSSLFRLIRNGMNVKQDKSGIGLPITRIETISEAVVDPTRVGFAGLEEADVRDWLLQPGDILFSHINSVQHIGKCAIYRGQPERLVHGMNLLCLRSDETKLHPEFAKYLLRSGQFRARLSNCIKKAVNQASVSIGDIQAIQVAVPSLPDQRRIAEILDKADSLRAERRAVLAKLDTLAQAIFLDMFGHPAMNPKGWPLKALSALGEISTGKTPPTGNEGMFGGAIPFATPGDLDAKLESTQRTITLAGSAFTKIVRPGSALVGCIGNIGKMAKTPVATAFNQQINAVEWGRDVNDDYGIAALVFAIPQMLALASSTTVPILNKTGFSKVRLPVPPLSIQRDFALRISAVGELTSTHRTALQLAESLFGALQDRAFRGEL